MAMPAVSADTLALITAFHRQQREVGLFFAELHDSEPDHPAAMAGGQHQRFRVADRPRHALPAPRPSEPGLDQVARHFGDRQGVRGDGGHEVNAAGYCVGHLSIVSGFSDFSLPGAEGWASADYDPTPRKQPTQNSLPVPGVTTSPDLFEKARHSG